MEMSNFTNVSTSSSSAAMHNFTCGAGLDKFHTWFVGIHGYVSVIVCAFGSVANLLNIVVLTRREMISPTNAILCGLAVADLLVMVEYIPYTSHSYLVTDARKIDHYSYGWASFVLFHAIFAQVFHTISIILTLTLAVWRYIAIAHPQRNRQCCSLERAKYAILTAYVMSPLICVPVYMGVEISTRYQMLDEFDRQVNDTYNGAQATNTTLYFVTMSESAKDGLHELNFWMYSVVIKLLPCVFLTYFSVCLIKALVEAKKRRKKLTTTTMLKMEESCNVAEGKKRKRKASRLLDKEKQTDRTTRMLLAVLLLFLLTEFPQGILGLLSVVLGKPFFNTCYIKLGELMDTLALINSAINFILYCAMSRQFRQTFNQLFCQWKLLGRWLPVPQHAENNNGNAMTNHTVTQVTHV